MPNQNKHMAAGAVVAGTANIAWQLYNLYNSHNPPATIWDAFRQVDLVEAALFTAGGAVVATLPDLLEPATNPNHRAFFHSLTAGGAVAYGAFGRHTEDWNPEDKFAVAAAALSFLSHLYLDGFTPKGLPLA